MASDIIKLCWDDPRILVRSDEGAGKKFDFFKEKSKNSKNLRSRALVPARSASGTRLVYTVGFDVVKKMSSFYFAASVDVFDQFFTPLVSVMLIHPSNIFFISR